MNLINTNNELLLRLIGDILDLSKIESGSIDIVDEKFDIVTLFYEIFASYENRFVNNDITIEAITDLNRCIVILDRNRIMQVVNNFISNAIKHTIKGKITISLYYENDGVKITVRDTGKGIPQEKHHLVFERFEKLDSFTQGTGLGLAICKAIIEAFRGEIGFDSVVNQGSVFWAWFPCKVQELIYKKENTPR